MKAKSHRTLGEYLLGTYLPQVPRRYRYAFLMGCTQPDKNPTTYLKGSLRCQWLRGHNWGNAQRYMHRISRRLENRRKLRLLDYYTLGKLIHYTTDAFTSAHNAGFPGDIQAHRSYENRLQGHFLQYLRQRRPAESSDHPSIMDAIRSYHRQYAAGAADIHRDCRYSILATSTVLALLTAKAG